MNIKLSGIVAFFLGLMFGTSGGAQAGWMTYTETATASGSLGNVAFTNATMTFTQTADSGSVYAGQGLDYVSQVTDNTATVTISSVGTARLTTDTDTFVNRGSAYAGIAYHGASYDLVLLSVSNFSFLNYDLKSPIGPVGGSTFYGEQQVATDRGLLTFQPTQSNLIFTAAAAVPEPSCVLMLAIGLGSIAAYCHRRGH